MPQKRKRAKPAPKRKPFRLNFHGDSNREFLVGLVVFGLFGLSATAAVVGGGKAGIGSFINPGTPPPAIHHDTVVLTLAQSKGINWYPLEKWQADKTYNWTGIESDVKDMQGAGISWARFTMSPDNAVNDRLVDLLKAHDIRVLAIIPENPPKSKGNFIQRLFYRDSVKKLAARYIDKVQYYEVGNEPNNPAFWNIDTADSSDQKVYEQSVADYIDHLKETVTAVKSGNPNAFIFLGGLSDEKVNRWLDAFMNQNGHTLVDGISIHIKAHDPTEMSQKVHALKVELGKVAEFAVKPIWITDFGFTTNQKDTSVSRVIDEKTKADYVLGGFAAVRNESLYGPVFWTKLEENENDKPGYGLVMKNAKNLQTTYLPAYDQLKSF
jgi:hypothetical protein